MRQKVKRYSRAAISVLLTLCMLVSCMTVGIIATDAAKVTADEAVGSDGNAVDRTVYMTQNTVDSAVIYPTYKVLYAHNDKNSATQSGISVMTNTGRTQGGYPVYQATIQDWWDGLTYLYFQGFDSNGNYVKEKQVYNAWAGKDSYSGKVYDGSNFVAQNFDTASAPQIFGTVVSSSWDGANLHNMTDEGNGIYSFEGTNKPDSGDIYYRIKYNGYYYKFGNSDGNASTDASNPTLTVVNGTSDAGSGAFKYAPGGHGYKVYFNTRTIQTWVEENTVNPNEPIYSLTGNVTDKYIVGSTITKPSGVNDSEWWSTYHPELAINTRVGDKKFSITFTTTSYEGIDVNFASTDNTEYSFRYNNTEYNTYGNDFDVTANLTNGKIESGLYVWPCNGGGSLKLAANTTYTITVDQTKQYQDNAGNPYGLITIDAKTVYANAIAMVKDFDVNTRSWGDAHESTDGGTATASPASGNKNELDPTFAASAANSGYEFAGWYSDAKCTTKVNSAQSFTEEDIDVTHTYYALYRQNPPSTSYGINVTKTGNGSVTPSTGVGVATGSLANTYTYEAYDGATVYFDAIPDDPTDSVIYQLGTANATNATATIEGNKVKLTNITGNVNLTVTFTEKTSYTVTLKGTNGKIKATAYNASGTQTATVSETENGSIQVPIGGTVKLESGTADSGKEFSNFKLDTGKYKRQANQSTGSSPMTIRPIDDMTAEAVYEDQGESSSWWLDFSPEGSGGDDVNLNKKTGLLVNDFNSDSSKDVYYAKFTISSAKDFKFYDGTRSFKFESDQTINFGDNYYPKDHDQNYSNATHLGTLNVSSSTDIYVYAMYNVGNKELKVKFSTTKLHGGSSSSIDTTGYQRIYAMDGIRDQSNFGETTITSGSGLLETDVEDAQHNSSLYYTGKTSDDHLVYYFDPNQDISFTVQTKVDASKTNLGVRGFVYNGKYVEAKYDSASGVYYATATVKAGSVVDINGENNNNTPILEVIPVYYNTTVPETELIKMYVDASTIENKFGYNIGYYSWYKDNTKHEIDENYPGQPLMKSGTQYYALVPKHYVGNTESYSASNSAFSGVLFNNLAEECPTHKEVLRSWGCSDMNYQTFDYEDPDRIFGISGVDTIEFVAKFEETDTIPDVHRDGTHWYNSEYHKATDLKSWATSTFPSNIEAPTAANKLNGFELLRNFDNKPVDVYGNVVTEDFSNSVFVISVGNQKVDSNKWDTVWMIYNGSNKSFITASANPADFINIPSGSQIAALKNKTVYINYEKFLDGVENPNDSSNTGDRIDGRWLYSLSEDDTVAHIRVATLGANNDTLNFMSYNNGGQYARLSSDDDIVNSEKEDDYGSIINLTNRTTKVKAVLQEFSGYEIVGFYQQKTGIQGAASDKYFSTSKDDYNEMDRDSRTVAKYTNTRENWIVVVLKPIPPSNILVTHEMYGGDGAHYGAGTFYVKAEALSPSGAVLASSGGFVDGGEGFTFENLNSVVRKVESNNPNDHYKIKVTLRTSMAGTNTLYAWYPQDFTTGAYGDPKSTDDNGVEARGKSGTQDTVYYVDVNDLFGTNGDGTFQYTTLAYYSDIDSAGAVYVTHQKLPTSAADGTFQTKVEVLNSSDQVIKTYDYQEGTVTVESSYTKRDSGNKLKFYLKTNPDPGANYLNTYSDSTGTTSVKPDGNTDGEFSLAPIEVSTLYENVGAPEQPIWQFKEGANTYNYYSALENVSKVLTIKKTVDVAHASETTFPITVEYSTDNGTTYQPLAGAAYTVNGDTGTAGTLDANGSTTIQAGEDNKLLITLTGAATVAKLKVTEGSTTYYQNPVYSVSNATNTTTTDSLTGCIAFTSTSEQSPVVTITNNIKRKDFTITKKVDAVTDPATTFNILVTLNGNNIPDTYTYTDGGATKNFSEGLAQITGATGNGASITVKNLPVGAQITVTENDPGTHYTLQSVSVTPDGSVTNGVASFTIDENKDHAVEIVNQKKRTVTVTKQFAATDTDIDDNATAFKVKIEKNTGSGWAQVTDNISDNNNNAVTKDGSNYYEIHRNQTLVLPEYPVGTQIRVTEADHQDDYYTYVSTDVTGEADDSQTDTWQASGEASASKKDGVQFTIGSADAAVVITNQAKRMTVVINKETDHVDDGSVFGIDVRTKQHNQSDASYAADTRGVVSAGTNTDTPSAVITDPDNPLYNASDVEQDGRYRVLKGNTITFSNIPVGTYFEVSEPYKGMSTVTKSERFTLETIEAVYNDASSNKLTVNGSNSEPTTDLTGKGINLMKDATFTVKNKIKKNSITITKTITDAAGDTNTEHTIQVTMLGNGENTGALTGIQYTRGTDTTTMYDYVSGANLTIKQGEAITFKNIPIGTFVNVKETAPGTSTSSVPYQFERIAVTENTADSVVISQTTAEASFVTKDVSGGATVTIYNKIQQFDFAVTKTTNIVNDTNQFSVNVQTSSTEDSGYSDFAPTAAGQFSISGLDDTIAFSSRWDNTNKCIKLKKGETLTIHYLPYGTYVRVKELNLPSGYICDSITAGTNTTAAELADYDGGKRVQITGIKAVTINNLKVREVTVTKDLLNSNDNQQFPIEVIIRPEGASGTAATTWSWTKGSTTGSALDALTLADGDSIIFHNVPVNAQITVNEKALTETNGTGLSNFTFDSISAKQGSTAISDTEANTTDSSITYLVPDADSTVTIKNNINTRKVTIAKQTDVGTGTFPITIEVKKSNEASFTPWNDDNNHANGIYDFIVTTVANPVIKEIYVPLDADVRVTEAANTIPNGFAFEKITLNNNADDVSSSNSYTYEGDKASSEEPVITVHNTQLHNLKITKTTNVNNTTDKFTFKAYYKNTSTDSWTAISESIEIVKDGTWTSPNKYKKGTLFKVEEVVPDKYSYDASGSSVSNSIGTAITNGFENITMGAEDVTVTVNNIVKTKNVTISKTADYTESASGAFTFNVKTKAEGENTATNCTYPYKLAGEGDYLNFTDGNVTLASGQSIVIYNVPVDTVVTVQETNAGTATSTTAVISNVKSSTGSYTSSTKTATFTVGASANPSVAFTNSKNKTLTITKAKPSGDSDVTDSTTTFQIQVTKDNAAYTGTAGTNYTASDGVTLSGGVFSLKMGDSVVLNVTNGEQYEISEINIDSKYTLTNVFATGSDSDVTNGKHFTIGNDNASVTFENTIKRANVTVQKRVPDYNSGNDEFPITVSYTKPGMAAESTIYNLKKDATDTLANLPYGTQVTVSENLTGDMAKKYQLATGGIKYTVDGSAQQTGNTFTMTDKNVAVTVTNELQKRTVTIVKKVVDKDNNALSDTSSFTLDVTAGGTTTQRTITQADSVVFDVDYGTAVTVGEQAKAGYILKDISTIPETITENTTITVTNYRVHDVTITKTVDDNTCTEYFPIKVSVGGTAITNSNYTSYTYNPATMPTTTGGNVYFDTTKNVFMLKAGQSFKITGIVEGTNVDVLEDTFDFGNNYAYNATESSVTDNKGTPTTDSEAKGFTNISVDKDVTVTIANKVLHTVEIKKTTDKATTETFNIQVFVNDNTNLIGATGWTVALDNATVDSDHYVVSKNGTITISGVPSGTKFKVVEVNGGTGDFKYDEDGSTVTGATKNVITDTNVYGYTFTTAHANVNAVVHNKEAAKYQYEIKYIYESYSAKTYKNNTNLTDDNRVIGADRSYTQTGEISTEDLNTYFDKAADGTLSFKDGQRKNFISKFAPYEDDFMLSLVWDDQNPTDATYVPATKTIKLETRATSKLERDVRVKFKLPYVSDTNLVPTGTTYDADAQQKILTTQYGNHVTNSSGNYVTAPLTLENNGTTMYFQYWQIKSDYQSKDSNFTDTDSKRCYYNSFNMTMYQDSYVEAIYKSQAGGGLTSFDPAQMSKKDTENGEARITFIETSRNQWNNNGGTSTDKNAGDRVYADFLLTFGYNDLALNTDASSTSIKTGFVMEQVALLDEEEGKYVTKKDSEYKTMYDGTEEDKTARENAVKTYIGNSSQKTYDDSKGTHTFKLNSTIALSSLDNKNQYKHSVDMGNKVLNGTELTDGTLKNYVYRGYSYIKIGNDIVLSDPVYFTIYDVAMIANGKTN